MAPLRRRDPPMTKLSDTELVILGAAAQRADLLDTDGGPERVVITSEGVAAIGVATDDDEAPAGATQPDALVSPCPKRTSTLWAQFDNACRPPEGLFKPGPRLENGKPSDIGRFSAVDRTGRVNSRREDGPTERRKASRQSAVGQRPGAKNPLVSMDVSRKGAAGETVTVSGSWRRDGNPGQTLFCNRAARVKGFKLAPAPRMVVWQGPLFCPRSAQGAAASWGQARARRINL
jgi:hypothetical protein